MLSRAATTNASTVAEITSPKNARSQSCSAANASSLEAVIRKTAPDGAKVAIRPAAPRQKKAQPPGMRLKAPKTKRKIRARAVSGLARDVKPGLNSSTKNNKNNTKEEIPEDAFVHSVRPTQEICLSIQITPASSQNNFTKLDMLLDLGANAIFIDKTWAEKHKVPLMPL